MTQKLQAIVIRSNDRKEKDKNILLFSIEQGKVWATLKGVKSPTAKMKIAQNPFCFGEFMLEDGKMGKIVTGFDAIETFHELGDDVDKYFEGTAMLEIVNAIDFSTQIEQAQVFVLLLKCLKSLCFGSVQPLYVLDKFLIELFAIVGSPLNVDKCACCASKVFDKLWIDYKDGSLVCSGCKGWGCEELSTTTLSALKVINNTDLEKLSTVKLAQESENGLLRVLVRNFDARFERKLKMIGILS